MGTDKASNMYLTDEDLDQLILSEYPYPIAVNYRRMLEAQAWEEKTRACIRVFEFGLRAMALGVISQYLIRDVEKVSDPQLNRLLLTRLSRATLGTWNEIFFKTLQVYEGKRDLFFMPELYDLHWDTSTSPHRPRKGLRAPFMRLIQIRNDLAHAAPTDDARWKAYFEESLRLLRQVLGRFTFLKNYHLIRILGAEGEKYWYDIYSGLQVTSPSQPLKTKESLTEGWFYLSKQEKRFLELHPLLIFWEKELAQAEGERMRDAAIFDRFRRTSVDYLATVLGERINLTDRTLLAEFIQMVYYNIEKVKMARREAGKLTWWLLKEVSGKVSSERIGDLRSKYRREVYLQREETKESFEEFLRSDKTCLVLIGKSGVGKSNFFLWLMDEYEDSSEVCTLMYNGARFSAETAVAEALTRDFELYLKLEGLADEKGIRDILFEINRIEGIADRKVVLLIDALNENPDAKGLLRRVDALVEASPYPWLKVVISSRPETWRTIKRGVRLAEHKYYREEATGELGVEMQPFSIEVEMKPFAGEELPAAYAKYQEVYGLQTDHGEIPVEVRQMLRDPLTLWLVAEIHRGQEIPQDIKASELYQRYVDVLIDTQRLYREDIRFLERELVPLMIREEEYANSITGETISVAETTDGKSLFELVHSDEVLSNGRRVNESFANICDAQILTRQEQDRGTYEVGFQYEGFYEHFGGKQLFEVHKDKPHVEKVETYRNLLNQINDSPFLWGVLKHALQLELSKLQNLELVEQLCYTEDQLSQDLLIATLYELGDEYDPGLITPLLQSLLVEYARGGDLKTRTAKRIAVRTARHLKLLDLLLSAAVSPIESIRIITAQETYYLWKDDHAAGMELLKQVAKRVKGRFGIPQRSPFEFCLIATPSILYGYSEEREALEPLQEVWRGILEDVGLASRRRHPVWNLVREAVVSIAIQLVARLMTVSKEGMRWQTPVSLPEFAAFFDLPSGRKETFRRLIPFLDPERTDIKEAMSDFRRIATHRDTLSIWLLEGILHAHFVKSADDTLQALEMIFEIGLNMKPPGPAMQYAQYILAAFGYSMGGLSPKLARKHLEMVETAYRKTGGKFRTATGAEYVLSNVGPTTMLYHSATGLQPPFLEVFLDEVFTSSPLNYRLLEQVTGLATDLALQFERYQIQLAPAFELFALILRESRGRLNVSDHARVRSLVVDALAWLRLYRLDDVEDFLATHEFSENELIQIRNKATETIGELLGRNGKFFGLESTANQFHGIRAELMWTLEQATMCKSAAQWFNMVVKQVINLVYGETVFDIGMPPREVLIRGSSQS